MNSSLWPDFPETAERICSSTRYRLPDISLTASSVLSNSLWVNSQREKCSGSARLPLKDEVFRRALATSFPVTEEDSISSCRTRLPLKLHVRMNSGSARRPLTSDSTSRCRRTSAPVIAHWARQVMGTVRPDFEHLLISGPPAMARL